jgi:hypothetical protein
MRGGKAGCTGNKERDIDILGREGCMGSENDFVLGNLEIVKVIYILGLRE